VANRESPYLVAGIDLHEEMRRLCALPVFAQGTLATRLPALHVRRARRRPNRLGFAVPDEARLSVTAYPGIRSGDAQETLLHELVHLHVGTERGHRRWHGRRFVRTLHRAMAEGYGLRIEPPGNALHGAYADALERLHARCLAHANAGRQLQLPLAV
jgi:hypothetical protein